MAVGDNALVGNLSYVALGREITFGTYTTCTAGLNVLSASLKTMKETKVIEEIQTSRTNSNFIQLGKTIEASLEANFSPRNAACNYLLHNAFGGGAITSATATGDTIGSGTFQHTVDINNFLTTYSSLCINARKGQATTGKVFQYDGLRVNDFTLNAELDEPLKMSVTLVGRDSTVTTNDVSSALNTNSQVPLSFINGRFSVETSTAGLTSTSYWSVQNFSFKIGNNISSDANSRRIGSDLVQVLPAGMANFELKAALRFDTTTAHDAMLNGTRMAAELYFAGPTMTGSTLRESIKLTFPYVIVSDSGDPDIGGPNEVLTSEVNFAVLRDPTTSGYAVKAVVINDTSSYA